MSVENLQEHYFQVTWDIIISNNLTKIERAFQPSQLFLSGNIPSEIINELIMLGSFNKMELIVIPLKDNYSFYTDYGEYIIEYEKLTRVESNKHTLEKYIPELMVSLGRSKGKPKRELGNRDNSAFLIDIFKHTLKILKENNEFS